MLLLLHSAWRDRRWWAGHPGVWVDNRNGSTSSCWGWLVNLHGRWVSGRNIWHRLRVERKGWSDLLDMLSWRGLRRATGERRAIGRRANRLQLHNMLAKLFNFRTQRVPGWKSRCLHRPGSTMTGRIPCHRQDQTIFRPRTFVCTE